jgi:hypothetical protein
MVMCSAASPSVYGPCPGCREVPAADVPAREHAVTGVEGPLRCVPEAHVPLRVPRRVHDLQLRVA